MQKTAFKTWSKSKYHQSKAWLQARPEHIKTRSKAMFTSDIKNVGSDAKNMFFNLGRFNLRTFSWEFLTSTILRWIAVITMFIDHFGYITYPELGWMRIVGRIAFPIFAFLVGVGMNFSTRKLYYLIRFLVMAIIIQIAIVLIYENNLSNTISPSYLNIMFTLFLGALAGYIHQKHQVGGLFAGTVIFLILFVVEWAVPNSQFYIDYQSYGFLVVFAAYLSFYYGQQKLKNPLIFKGIFIFAFIFINIVWVFFFGLMGFTQIYSLVTISLFLLYSFKKPTKFWALNSWFLWAYALSFVIPGLVAMS